MNSQINDVKRKKKKKNNFRIFCILIVKIRSKHIIKERYFRILLFKANQQRMRLIQGSCIFHVPRLLESRTWWYVLWTSKHQATVTITRVGVRCYHLLLFVLNYNISFSNIIHVLRWLYFFLIWYNSSLIAQIFY